MIDVSRLESTVKDLENQLKGLLATDIWERESGQSLAGLNRQPAAVALFNEMTAWVDTSLSNSGFPALNNYYVLELEGDTLVMVIKHGDDVLQGILCNSRLTNMGTLLALGLRTSLEGVAKSRRYGV